MAVPLDENLLLGVAGLIFVPLFIFFVKLLIEIGGIKNRLEYMYTSMEEYKNTISYVNDVRYDIRDIKRRIDQIERDLRRTGSGGLGVTGGGSPV